MRVNDGPEHAEDGLKILGISASPREWGNSDLLVRSALEAAASEGATTRFLRLTDLCLRRCNGCMVCVFKDRECALDEGLPVVVEAMRWADAVVLGSPTYLLGPTAAVKTLQERLLRPAALTRDFAGKPGVAIAAAGVRGCDPFVLPQLALTFLSLGMPVVDQFVGYGQGPGEVLWDAEALARAAAAGRALAHGASAYLGRQGACPSCHFDLVTLGEAGRGHCPLCDLPGTWHLGSGAPHFEADPGAQSRWTEESVRRHFEERLLPSRQRFLDQRSEIRARIDQWKENVIHG